MDCKCINATVCMLVKPVAAAAKVAYSMLVHLEDRVLDATISRP